MRAPPQCRLRNDVEWVPTVDAVSIKVAVEGEDTAEMEPLSSSGKRRIGEVHWGILILLHERP